MTTPPPLTAIRLWLLWIAVNTGPWLLLSSLCLGIWGAEVGLAPLVMAWLVACGGVGWGQAQVLRRALPGVRHWLLATAIGGVMGLLAFFLLVMAPLGIGLTVGTAQWWVLRGRVPQAWRWWLACIVSGAIGVGVIFLLGMWVVG
ncbi:MAG: hypothetical protein VKJ09_03170, partial [Leptolyngbya sp.]|nr:hypothetical protein [Leptolyngbya sp.]